jgi:hypothetical protein
MVHLLKVHQSSLHYFKVEYIQLLYKHCVLVLLRVSSRCSFSGKDSRRLLLLGKISQPSMTIIPASSSRTSYFRMEGEMSCGARVIGAEAQRRLRRPRVLLGFRLKESGLNWKGFVPKKVNLPIPS